MQVDSKPEELDAIDRDLMQMMIEREALKKETDAASKDRLAKLEKEIADLDERSKALTGSEKPPPGRHCVRVVVSGLCGSTASYRAV